jgi:hypothetical protein
MPSELVLTAPEDLPELTEFLLGVFHASSDAPFVRPEMMQWKYFSPRPDWNGSRSYVMRGEGRIFAHSSVAPVTFRPQASRGGDTRHGNWHACHRLGQRTPCTDCVFAAGAGGRRPRPATSEYSPPLPSGKASNPSAATAVDSAATTRFFFWIHSAGCQAAPNLNPDLLVGDEAYLLVPGYPFET